MSQQISIPDPLYRRLSEQAQRNKVPVENLVAHLLEEAIVDDSTAEQIEELTWAYAEGRTPPSVGSWEVLKKELAETAPSFPSLEAAMEYARRRS